MQPVITASVFAAFLYQNQQSQSPKSFIYRDDIGAWWGIKGYQEMVTQVGTHRGEMHWPQKQIFNTFDSASLRRGFHVFINNCTNCHGMIFKKYDILIHKGFKQLQLSNLVSEHFTIHPAHHHFKQYYYQQWDDRDRFIFDHIYPTYYSQDQAKNANGGVWPSDLSKIMLRPGYINYTYNLLTGYHYKQPYGIQVPKGKYFNPYFDHMVIGMPRQLHDGMIQYADGTPASTPQMAYDVTNFIDYVQKGHHGRFFPDFHVFKFIVFCGLGMLLPLLYLKTTAHFRNLMSMRHEMYAVRDKLGYKHFKAVKSDNRAYTIKHQIWT